ncbi:hypothetical protein ACG1BZ_17260 [Microbulbifer sp. CNSA002]|uniref:hypothetical protein n=1 Tax=Microbulbifer sp. CNSA002 TaxID=3373604 RepID=UPI0039B6AFD6
MNNLPVRVVAGNGVEQCEGRSSDSKTDKLGTFYLAPIEKFNFMSVIMAHSFFPWSVCALSNDSWITIAQDKAYALVDSGPVHKVEIECNSLSPFTQCAIKER